jgi:hypothetical protein
LNFQKSGGNHEIFGKKNFFFGRENRVLGEKINLKIFCLPQKVTKFSSKYFEIAFFSMKN